MNRPGPAASWTTRASIATCTGWRVNGEMIPQPIVSRSVSRAISAETTVEPRASIWCLRHQGYASASQTVSIPASSITRADSSISSSGSIVSCITPMRNGTATASSLSSACLRCCASGLRDRPRTPPARPGGCPARRRRVARSRLADLLLERREHVPDLLVDDRLQHALAHRADRAGDLHVGLPAHRRAGAGLGEVELRLHVHDRADAVALRVQGGELRRALLDLLEVDRHPQPAEPERNLHLRLPVPVVLDLEALDAGHQLRHLGRVVQHLPDDGARRRQLLRPLDLHAGATETFVRVDSGSWSIDQTRW